MNLFFYRCQFLILLTFVFWVSDVARAESAVAETESICYGTTSNGRLENGVQLPSNGKNFVSYGKLAEWLGRTYVHSKVRDVVVESYRILEIEQPGKVFKYGETGFREGGEFKPHKTHRNGLSIDFMVPVVNSKGESVHLPTHALNKYGYAIEFDDQGRFGEYRIDYDALAAHMVALHRAAMAQGIKIWRILFDPGLQSFLYASKYGKEVRESVFIPKKRSWVRHDEHYHVDFKLECEPL